MQKPIVFEGKTTIDEKDKEHFVEAYGFLNTFLDGKQWVAGDFISVADYSIVATVSSSNTLMPVDSQKYPNVVAWLKRMEARPEYAANVKGLNEFTALFKSKLSMP